MNMAYRQHHEIGPCTWQMGNKHHTTSPSTWQTGKEHQQVTWCFTPSQPLRLYQDEKKINRSMIMASKHVNKHTHTHHEAGFFKTAKHHDDVPLTSLQCQYYCHK